MPVTECCSPEHQMLSAALLQPEDVAKDVNLKPPKLFVAHYASQKRIDKPQAEQPNIRKSSGHRPPVMIVSYGSQSTPNALNFHHGAYAMAQPDSARLQVSSQAEF